MENILKIAVDHFPRSMDGMLNFSFTSSFMGNMLDLSHENILQSLESNSSNSDTDSETEARSLFGAASSGYGDKCCPPVVDPYTWLALIAGIALATYFLRITITTTLKRKKRRKREQDEDDEEMNDHANIFQGIK